MTQLGTFPGTMDFLIFITFEANSCFACSVDAKLCIIVVLSATLMAIIGARTLCWTDRHLLALTVGPPSHMLFSYNAM